MTYEIMPTLQRPLWIGASGKSFCMTGQSVVNIRGDVEGAGNEVADELKLSEPRV